VKAASSWQRKSWILWRNEKPNFRFLYPLDIPVKEKIEKLAKEIYGAKGVIYSGSAERDIRNIENQGLGRLADLHSKDAAVVE